MGPPLTAVPSATIGVRKLWSSQKPPRGRGAWAGCRGAGAGKTSPKRRAPLSHPSLTWDLCGIPRQRARRTQRQGWEAGGQGRADHRGVHGLRGLGAAGSSPCYRWQRGRERRRERSRASSGLRAPSCGVRAELLLLCSGMRFPSQHRAHSLAHPSVFVLLWPLLLPAHQLTTSAFHPLPGYLWRRKGGFWLFPGDNAWTLSCQKQCLHQPHS